MKLLERPNGRGIGTYHFGAHSPGMASVVPMTGQDRFQTLLLLQPLDDYIGRDYPTQFIGIFVDGHDFAASGFASVQPKATNSPGLSSW